MQHVPHQVGEPQSEPKPLITASVVSGPTGRATYATRVQHDLKGFRAPAPRGTGL
jgi:hypothetical protein